MVDLSQTETKSDSWSLLFCWEIKEFTRQEILRYFNCLLYSGEVTSQTDIGTKMGPMKPVSMTQEDWSWCRCRPGWELTLSYQTLDAFGRGS